MLDGKEKIQYLLPQASNAVPFSLYEYRNGIQSEAEVLVLHSLNLKKKNEYTLYVAY